MKRGAAPVDPYCGRHNTHMVYSNTEAVWDAMLNQTNVTHNNNKYELNYYPPSKLIRACQILCIATTTPNQQYQQCDSLYSVGPSG